MLAEHQKEIPADAEGLSGATLAMAISEPPPDRVQIALRLLALLYNLKFFDSIVSRFYAGREYKVLPPYIINKTLHATRRIFDSFEASALENRLREFTLQIFRNTSRPIPRSKTMTVDEYIETFTGANTRWETIATIFATAGVGLLARTEEDPLITELGATQDIKNNPDWKERLLLQLSDATTNCLLLCDQAASSNEILAYAQFTDVAMKTQQYGDSSKLYFPLCCLMTRQNSLEGAYFGENTNRY